MTSRVVSLVVLAGAALPLGASTLHAGGSQAATCLGKRVTIVGTPGNDRLVGGAKRDVILAGDGDDAVDGGVGRDVICGGEGNDTLGGAGGSDELSGDNGNDRLDGGAGLDYAVYENSPEGVSVDLSRGAATGWGTDALSTIEALIGSRSSDRLTGNGRANYFAGLEGDDDITAGGGNDYLDGGRGRDRLKGGKGFDTVDFFFSRQGVTVDLGSGIAQGYGRDRTSNVEDLDGSRFKDVLVGNSLANWIRGFGGNDIIVLGAGHDRGEGGNGKDRIRAGAGNDRIAGGPGRDALLGGRGRDRLSGGGGRDLCRDGERLIGCE
jgi:Ca2+-binding RTX toxin-like protein